jgi:soluble lytic murein transglycosylase-like protein
MIKLIKTAVFISLLFSFNAYSKVSRVNETKALNIITKEYKVNKKIAKKILDTNKKYSSKFKIPPRLGLAIIAKESSFKVTARNRTSKGLMQVNTAVWKKRYNMSNIYTIENNIRLGYSILDEYIDKNKGNLKKALSNYNGTKSLKYYNAVMKHVNRY